MSCAVDSVLVDKLVDGFDCFEMKVLLVGSRASDIVKYPFQSISYFWGCILRCLLLLFVFIGGCFVPMRVQVSTSSSVAMDVDATDASAAGESQRTLEPFR